ncbi:MAG: RnfABCDGE type electron transport complex subunit G [Nitrospinota bacterium]|nr:RnfABCDGE type electron transport complex subunit G [Nitrospinota bacterium]
MKDTLKMGVTLAIFCGVAAASLQVVYSLTQPIIDENVRISAIKKRQEVIPEAKSFDPIEIESTKLVKNVFAGKDEDGNTIGYVMEITPRGFGGEIKATISVLPDGNIMNLAINKLDQQETPGLGARIVNPSFRESFKGKSGDALKLKKDGGEIDAITSATISSRAVSSGMKGAWDWFMENRASFNK